MRRAPRRPRRGPRPGIVALPVAALAAALAAGCASRSAPVAHTPAAHTPAATGDSSRPAPPDTSAALPEGAGSSLMALAPTRVRRALEEVRLTRQAAGWQVECTSVFVGGPVPETVRIGLPEFEVPGESPRGGTLSDLEFRLDGIAVAPTSALAPEEDVGAPGGIRHFHVWRIGFATEEVRVARVRYRVGASRTEEGEELLFFYLNPGTPWAGPSGRVNVYAWLGEGGTRDLIVEWVRPDDYFVTAEEAVWRLDAEEPAQDLVLAVRPPADWLAAVPRREEGLLSLPGERREARMAAGTPREWSFWRAHLWARHGHAASDEEWAARLAAEPWYRARDTPEPVAAWSAAERLLLAELEDRLEAWERRALPDPEAARELAEPAGGGR